MASNMTYAQRQAAAGAVNMVRQASVVPHTAADGSRTYHLVFGCENTAAAATVLCAVGEDIIKAAVNEWDTWASSENYDGTPQPTHIAKARRLLFEMGYTEYGTGGTTTMLQGGK